MFRKYVFSQDHTVIGLQYALTSLFFLLIGFSLAVLFRWQLAYPGQPVPIVGQWLGELNAPGGMATTACAASTPFKRKPISKPGSPANSRDSGP